MLPQYTPALAARFWAKVDKSGDCWLWHGQLSSSRYGLFSVRGKNHSAHRVAWFWANGSIPDGLVLDHLCRVRNCVNPSHLEPVTSRENILRGVGAAARHARITHCPAGHPYDEGNTRWRPKGWRLCRVCTRISRARDVRSNHHRRVDCAPTPKAEV